MSKKKTEIFSMTGGGGGIELNRTMELNSAELGAVYFDCAFSAGEVTLLVEQNNGGARTRHTTTTDSSIAGPVNLEKFTAGTLIFKVTARAVENLVLDVYSNS